MGVVTEETEDENRNPKHEKKSRQKIQNVCNNYEIKVFSGEGKNRSVHNGNQTIVDLDTKLKTGGTDANMGVKNQEMVRIIVCYISHLYSDGMNRRWEIRQMEGKINGKEDGRDLEELYKGPYVISFVIA